MKQKEKQPKSLCSHISGRRTFPRFHGIKEIQDISMVTNVDWAFGKEILSFKMPSSLEEGFKCTEKHGCRWKPLWSHFLQKVDSIITSSKWKKLQTNTNLQTILLVSIVSKLLRKLTFRVCKTRFWCAKSSIITSISSFQRP